METIRTNSNCYAVLKKLCCGLAPTLWLLKCQFENTLMWGLVPMHWQLKCQWVKATKNIYKPLYLVNHCTDGKVWSLLLFRDAYPGLLQVFRMKSFVAIVNMWKPLTLVSKCSVLDICESPRYACFLNCFPANKKLL